MTDIEKWLNSLKDDDKSINTIVSYENDVNEFMDFTQKEVEDITKIDIDNYKVLGGFKNEIWNLIRSRKK